MSAYIYARITIDLPGTVETDQRILQCILDVVQLNWLEGWDEWAMGYVIPEAILLLSSLQPANQSPLISLGMANPCAFDSVRSHSDTKAFEGVSLPDRSVEVSTKFSPLTDCRIDIQLDATLDVNGHRDLMNRHIELSTNENAFYECRKDRARGRMVEGWSGCRAKAIHRGEEPSLPPRIPQNENWWRRYEELTTSNRIKENVGAENFRYFMRVIETLQKTFPVTHYEECDEITNYESYPDRDARMDREIAESEGDENRST